MSQPEQPKAGDTAGGDLSKQEDSSQAVVRLGGQSGDVGMQDVAGGNMYKTGADFDSVLSFLRSYTFDADQRRETMMKALQIRLDDVEKLISKGEMWRRDEQRIINEAIVVIRTQIHETTRRIDAIAAETAEDKARRIARQTQTDAQFAEILSQSAENGKHLQGLLLAAMEQEHMRQKKAHTWRVIWRVSVIIGLIILLIVLIAIALTLGRPS